MDQDDPPSKSDLDGDTEMALVDMFDSTELGVLSPAGDVERLDGTLAGSLAGALAEDEPAPPAADADSIIQRLADSDTDSRIQRLIDAESVALADADSVALADADSVVQRLADADSIAQRLADADSVAQRIGATRSAGRASTQPLGVPRRSALGRAMTEADSMVVVERGSDSFVAIAEESARRVTEPFWPPPGPLPAGTHGPRRQARMFTAVEEEAREARDWLDSDQVTVVPSPDDL